VKVAVIYGGRSSEHEISLQSGASVAAGLREAGHEVTEVLIDRSGRWRAGDEELAMRAGGGLLGCDVAFPVLHGPFGEDGTVQGMLECLDVAYAGPSVLAAAVAMDKLICKRLLAYGGLPQVEFAEVGEEGWREHVAAMPRPLWVKPSRLGSSVGISRVSNTERELDQAVEAALAYDPRVIVEADAGGREVECSVIGNPGIGDHESVETSLPGAIVTKASDWYDYEAKYAEGGMELVVPAPLDASTVARVRELAEHVFRAVGGTGLARCDFFVRDQGEVLVNEINTIPGFTATSVFGKLFEASGVPYPELCDRLVRLGLDRHKREREYRF
jgi:D-alanine-D-alanine ligase